MIARKAKAVTSAATQVRARVHQVAAQHAKHAVAAQEAAVAVQSAEAAHHDAVGSTIPAKARHAGKRLVMRYQDLLATIDRLETSNKKLWSELHRLKAQK